MAIVSEKSRKWIIAFFMSFLMVAFALPSWFSGRSAGRQDSIKGVVFGKQTVKDLEIARAKEEIDLLVRLRSTGTNASQMLAGSPLISRIVLGDLTQYRFLSGMSQQFAAQAALVGVDDVVRNPLLFALLKREAIEAGIRPSRDRVESILRNDVSLPESIGPDYMRAIGEAVTDLVMIQTLGEQMSQAVKVTRPEVQSMTAQSFQSLRVLVLPIDDEAYRSQVPAPTEEQIKEQFNRWGSHPANEQDFRGNPFGFGYEQGDRVKVQYLLLPRGELLRVARMSRSDYDWEVEANKYYVRNPKQFEATPPASGANGAPAVKPFESVRQEILNRLIDTKADQLTQQVQRRIIAVLSADYRNYADAVSKKQTPPATALGHPYDSIDYLRAVAGKIEAETQVKVSVVDYSDRYQSAQQLEKENPIGRASTEVNDRRSVFFADYAIRRIRPFFDKLSPTARVGITPLEVNEPTPAFTDEQGSVYFARITDAAPARVPRLEEVENAVKEDVITIGAHERAMAVAETWASEGRTLFLTALAESKGKKAVLIPALRGGIELPTELTLSPLSRQMLIDGAYMLLRGDPATERPRTVVSLPRDRKVAIVELEDVEQLAQRTDPLILQLQTMQELRTMEQLQFLTQFYRQDSVFARTKWTPSATGKVEEPLPQ